MMWDSDITRDEFNDIIYEWFTVCYGDAADSMYQYFRMCEYAGKLVGCWCGFYSSNADKVDNEYMAQNFDYMWELYEEGKALCDSSVQEEFVERYMAGMMYICIGITYEDRYTNGTDEQRAVIAERYTEMYRIFKSISLRLIPIS